eukprot:14838461-Alexandrium_andersonii.AAC.1
MRSGAYRASRASWGNGRCGHSAFPSIEQRARSRAVPWAREREAPDILSSMLTLRMLQSRAVSWAQ